MLKLNHFTAPIAGIVRNFTASKALTSRECEIGDCHFPGRHRGGGLRSAAVVLAIYFIYDFERMRGFLYALTPRRYHLRLARIAQLGTDCGRYMPRAGDHVAAIGVFTFAS